MSHGQDERKSQAILPGATLGVLGSGQLGRMFAIAARRMGYRVHTLSPESDSPTGQVADLEITASYDDLDAVSAFAKRVSVVTFEFENVPSATAEIAARFAPVRPAGQVLHVTQHRLREKLYLGEHGFPVTPFRAVRSAEELQVAIRELGCPAVLKTAGWGYDGKGQAKIQSIDEAVPAWERLGTSEAILEGFVDFRLEVSVIGARGFDGEFTHFGLLENSHSNHILDVTVAPARVSARVAAEAEAIARGVLESLDVVGVLCVEMFLTHDDRLLINELAPRPHNSGHLTFDANVTSQFEQQVRAICGLPLGSTELLRPSAMANLLGDVWENGEPRWAEALRLPEVKLHLYGKSSARAGRKMGHLTAMADSADEAERIVREARRRLMG
ncbi:MAG: 5-(carboxyamino)imidazole ribonucleotide synthase [Planctomycetota bacterium]|nr:MAG: 5-(carboxyamino)imidazole ribonucleotide synthase [Planctomycetota bacterium]